MCPAVGDAERVGRRHTWVPPYRGISKGAVKRGVGDADPYAHLVGGRCGRDDGGIVPYKKLVGRGQCAPPLGVQYVSAAAHMGAALREHIKGYGGTGRRGRRPLQRNLQNMRRGGGSAPPVSPFSSAWAGGVEPRPYAGNKMISIKMSFRGAKRRGNPYSHVSGVRRGGITDCHTSVRAGSQ